MHLILRTNPRDTKTNTTKQKENPTMPVEWIILIAVLMLAGVAGCLIVRRYEKPWQAKEAEKSDVADTDPEHRQPDIPVWRDKPTQQKD